jgi:hypothetical protein
MSASMKGLTSTAPRCSNIRVKYASAQHKTTIPKDA